MPTNIQYTSYLFPTHPFFNFLLIGPAWNKLSQTVCNVMGPLHKSYPPYNSSRCFCGSMMTYPHILIRQILLWYWCAIDDALIILKDNFRTVDGYSHQACSILIPHICASFHAYTFLVRFPECIPLRVVLTWLTLYSRNLLILLVNLSAVCF